MSTKKKLLEAAAGNAGEAVYVDDVFSTYLYTGNGSTQTITNGIDLDGEGGLVWIKNRAATNGAGNTANHILMDTVLNGRLRSNTTGALSAGKNITDLSTGFDVTGSELNYSGDNLVSWTFRKQPGFFDIVTYTGTGSAQNISHNLGSVPGCIIIKNTSNTADWTVYHRGVDASAPEDYNLALNKTDARDDNIAYFNDTAPTSTVFTVNSDSTTNTSGDTYVAYLFAHDAQDFGTDEDESIIKCGSYTGNGSSDGPAIDLGFEPQWIMIKCATGSTVGNWLILDTMRGWTANTGNQDGLYANLNDAEIKANSGLSPTSTGFKIKDTTVQINGNGNTYIYIAIRRPHKPASEFAATDLLGLYQGDGTGPPGVQTSFPVDWGFYKNVTSGTAKWEVATRLLQGKELAFESTAAEVDDSKFQFDYQDGWRTGSISSIFYAWNFRRAPGFFDVVAYTGTGNTGDIIDGAYTQTLGHNLGAVPELVIIKNRDNATSNSYWLVSAPIGTGYLRLNETDAYSSFAGFFSNKVYWTDTTWNVQGAGTANNASGDNYIAYLFATVPGISKVGTYSGTGSNVDVDCGFTSGARFVLVKRTDSTGDWYLWDSERGIVAGNDPYLFLNSTAAQVTSTDYIDPLSSGFTITSSAPAALNASGGTYIFLAIA